MTPNPDPLVTPPVAGELPAALAASTTLADFAEALANLPTVDAATASAALQTRRDERIAELLRQADLPARAVRFLGEFEKQAAADQADGWGLARRQLAAQLARKGGATLALIGSQGLGKTVLAVDALQTAARSLRTVRFTDVCGLLAALGDAKERGALRAELEDWVAVDVLAIDQFDKVPDVSWEARWFFGLLDRRHNAERVTLLVGNLEPSAEAVAAAWGESLAQRIEEAGGLIPCQWERVRA